MNRTKSQVVLLTKRRPGMMGLAWRSAQGPFLWFTKGDDTLDPSLKFYPTYRSSYPENQWDYSYTPII